MKNKAGHFLSKAYIECLGENWRLIVIVHFHRPLKKLFQLEQGLSIFMIWGGGQLIYCVED